MPKVSVILVIYNAKRYIKPVFDSIFEQTHKDLEVVAVINGSSDGSKELIRDNYPQVKIIDPGANLWFSKGNNLGIRETDGEFVFLVNQDMVLEPDHVEKLLIGFKDEKVAAVTGKILRYDFERDRKTNVIDTTGIVMLSSGRARDRGQLEQDHGQYDAQVQVFGVSGACPMYRRSALEKVKYCDELGCEYFDEDFVAYWEDVDLSWRFNNAGYKCLYVPQAIGYHGRTAGQAKDGYLHIWNFIKHHKTIPPAILKLNYTNHILMYLKNTKRISLLFVLREIAMLAYVVVFETRTLSALPKLFRLYPRMRKKRAFQGL